MQYKRAVTHVTHVVLRLSKLYSLFLKVCK